MEKDSTELSELRPASKNYEDWVPFILLALVIGFVPLVVYLRVVEYKGAQLALLGRPNTANFFTWYKAVWLYIFSGLGMAWYLVNRTTETNWYHRPIVVYAVLAILSTVFSEHPEMALWGDSDRHEGLLTQLAYVSVLFLAINLPQSVKHLKFLIGTLFLSAFCLSIIGVCQFFGYDYFFGGLGVKYLIPEYLKNLVTELGANPQQGIFLTFGNSNFVGSYMAMLFPLSLAFLLGFEHRWRRCVFFTLHLLVFFNLLGCKSRAGMIGAAVASVILLMFLRKTIAKKIGLILVLAASYFAIAFSMDIYTMSHGQKRLLASTVGRPLHTQKGFWGNFEDLQLEGDRAIVNFDGLKMTVKFNNEKIEFYDQHERLIPYRLLEKPSDNDGNSALASVPLKLPNRLSDAVAMYASISGKQETTASETTKIDGPGKEYLVLFPEKDLRGYIIYAWPDLNLLKIGRGGVTFHLCHTGSEFRILNHRGVPSKIIDVEAWGFRGWEKFGSARGYIWSRTLPMLKKTILIGNGPDTFFAHFPNHDYLGKLRFVTSGIQRLVDKPHNFYLQTAINTGVISLLFLLAMFFVYLYQSFKLYWNCQVETFISVAGMGIAFAVFAYLVTAFFNDSIVAVAPVFFAVFGLGIAVNSSIRAGFLSFKLQP